MVVPVGGRAAELAVQRAAVRLADRLGVPVRAVHVRQGPYGPPVDLFGHVGSLCDGRDVPLDAEVLEGDVVETLCADLTPSDLVIVGADAGNHAGDDAEAGDRSWAVVVEALVRRAPCRVQVLAQE